MNRKETIFFYTRDKHGKRLGHTVAVILREGMMFYGDSLCSEKDQFVKKVGRDIALQRAEERYQRYLERKNSGTSDKST